MDKEVFEALLSAHAALNYAWGVLEALEKPDSKLDITYLVETASAIRDVLARIYPNGN